MNDPKHETPKQRARRIATEITVEVNKNNPYRFLNEDDMIEYRRELQSDIEASWDHRYF